VIEIKWEDTEDMPFITSVVKAGQQETRDRLLALRAQEARGKRGQPPMTDRLQAVTVYVEYLENRGVPFATARNSKMNRCVQTWLGQRAQCTKDSRKSRRRGVGPDAVEDLLKEVQAYRRAAAKAD
jgi:hypothetical protein